METVGGPETYWSENKIFEEYFPEKVKSPNGFCGNAKLIKKEIWLKHHLMNLNWIRRYVLSKKIVQRGGRIGYVSDAVIYHYHHENWRN